MAESAQRQRSSSSFDFGAYHTLDDVSTSGEEYSGFFWSLFMLSSIKHPILGSKMSLQLLLAHGFGFCSINFVLRAISQRCP